MTLREMWRRVQYLRHRDEYADELREEMQLHVELRARKMRGQAVAGAEFAARRQFGNPTLLAEASAGAWGWGAWERLAQDLRHCFRALRKTPAFTIVAVVTLALGLGINSAVFSVVNAVMLRGLPYPDPARLVQFWGLFLNPPPGFVSPEARFGGPARTNNLSAPAFVEFQRGASNFLDLAAFTRSPHNLTGIGKPAQVWGESVTTGFFSLLGANAAQGRVFLSEDERAGAGPVAILSYAFWQRRLGGDAAVLERSIVLDGQPYRVIGVLPPDFQSPGQIAEADSSEYFLARPYQDSDLKNYGSRFLIVLGRLKPGVSLLRAQAEIDAIGARLEGYSGSKRGFRTMVAPLQDDLVRHVGRSLFALLGASALIVLITCGNVANLLLVRAIARHHETSVRFALGASRFRVVRQFLMESLVVAFTGSVVGLSLGDVLLRLLIAIAPAEIPRIHSVSMDWRVFVVSAALATLTGILFGLAPAWRASRTRPAASLRSTKQPGGDPNQARWRSGLTIAEVALSMMLLVGAGLLIKSFVRLAGVDLGFQPGHVLAMSVNLPDASYRTPEKRLQFFQELEQRTRNLPGVQSVAFANRMPLRGGWSTGVTLVRPADEIYVGTDGQAVSPGYFATVGIVLLRGRLITEADGIEQERVAVVNQEFARKYLKDIDPIGREVYWNKQTPLKIVGVVNDIRRAGKDAPIRTELYVSAAQADLYPVRLGDFAIRTTGDPRLLKSAIQAQVWAIDPDQPVTSVKTFDQIIDDDLSGRWFDTLLLVIFAGVAVGIAVIGVFGVLQYSVSQRTPEFGIRIALGAQRSGIHALVFRQAGRLILAGVAIGLAGAFVMTRFLESMLFEVPRHDLWTYIAAAALLAAVSATAAAVPARRGASVDPIVALRYE
ncbi:MAG TPA: ABC transporter permease [Bryobacteraceae bacterium]|nr:ABC transporter permease [Bryobacteraceae bacterium]